MASELIPTVWSSEHPVVMADTCSQQPSPSAAVPGSSSSRPLPPVAPRPQPVAPLRKPPQVVMIRKDEPAVSPPPPPAPAPPSQALRSPSPTDEGLVDMGSM